MHIDIFYRSRLSACFEPTFKSPANLDEAREMMATAILANLDTEDRGEEYEAGWKSLAESARKAEMDDVLEFDERAWKISHGWFNIWESVLEI